MIIKQVPMKSSNKSSYKDLINYLTNDQGKVSRVKSVNFTNLKVERLKSALLEVQSTQNMNTRAKSDKTMHLIVSFQEGENPSDETLKEIENDVCIKLGLNEHQRISVIHDDTDNLHMHIAINKIHPETYKLKEPFQSYKKLSNVAAECEKKYNLRIDNHIEHKIKEENIVDTIEIHRGEETLCSFVRNLKKELEKANSWQEIHELLSNEDIGLKIRGNGLVFFKDGVYVKASTVAREFSKSKLEKKLGNFEENKIIDIEEDSTNIQTKYSIKNSAKKYTDKEQNKLWIEYQEIRINSREFSRSQKSEAFLEYKNNIGRIYQRIKLERKIINFLKVPKWMKAYFDFYYRYKLSRKIRNEKIKLNKRLTLVGMIKQSWLCFLKMKSNIGDDIATKILKNRYYKEFNNTKISTNVNTNTNEDIVITRTENNVKDFSNLKQTIENKSSNYYSTSKGNRIYKYKNVYIKVSDTEIRSTKISDYMRSNQREERHEDLLQASEKLKKKLSQEEIKLSDLQMLNAIQQKNLIEQIGLKDKEKMRKKMLMAKRNISMKKQKSIDYQKKTNGVKR